MDIDEFLSDRRAFRALVRRFLPDVSGDEFDDVVQDCLVRLLLAERRVDIRDRAAFRATLARRRAAKLIERRQRERRAVDELRHEPFRARDISYERLARCRFVMLEFFAKYRSDCHELALDYFDRLSWPEVAERADIDPQTVRKRWSRCVDALRRFADQLPDLRDVL